MGVTRCLEPAFVSPGYRRVLPANITMSEHMAGHEIWALVPVKRLSQAKQRLKGVLSPGQRQNLARVMLCDVLETLRAAPSLAGIVLVSADPDVRAMAPSFGASLIFDASES